MKDSKPPLRKTIPMRVVSHETMTADQETGFTKAIDALLAELVRHVDRRNRGGSDGEGQKHMAG